jgi:hypothetical protein
MHAIQAEVQETFEPESPKPRRCGNNNKPWGGRWTLPYQHPWYGKVQTGLMPTSTSKGEEEEEKGRFLCLPELGCLATYMGYVSICLC